MAEYFIATFGALALTELIKGLSANGTPPILQRFSWQIHLAYFMWSNIKLFRSLFVAALVIIFIQLSSDERGAVLAPAIAIGVIWGFIYWLFNRFWVGKYKFLPISQRVFKTAGENDVDLSIQVLGVDHNGEQKAFPTNMLFYHHQISDDVGGHPIAATYCGMCRAGRVYDAMMEGQRLHFSLVGAVNFNAILRDDKTGTWWRQETGEAAKGTLQGKILEDMPFEQMSLKNWLEKYPDTKILQYDPAFEKKYNFLEALLKYEVSFPGWHMQKTPPLIVGIEVGELAQAYDWNHLAKARMVHDRVGDTDLLAVMDEEGVSAFVYDRMIDGEALDFTLEGSSMKDTKTGSSWDLFGRCVKGKLKGAELSLVQSHKQFVRAWITFHPKSSFYRF